jgi:hypothetical protein
VGEVDQLQDAVDERVAERDEPVDGAVGEADEEDVPPELGRLDEVDDQPDDDEADEAEPDRRQQRRPAGVEQPVERRGLVGFGLGRYGSEPRKGGGRA